MDQRLMKARMSLLEGMAKSFSRIALTPITVSYAYIRTFMIYQLSPYRNGYSIDRMFNFLANSKLISACERGFDILNETVGKYRKNKQEIQQQQIIKI